MLINLNLIIKTSAKTYASKLDDDYEGMQIEVQKIVKLTIYICLILKRYFLQQQKSLFIQRILINIFHPVDDVTSMHEKFETITYKKSMP